MKIRNKIVLWITGAGMVAALLFSIIVAYEMLEQPYELLDSELESQATTFLFGFAPRAGTVEQDFENKMLESLGKLYWFKMYNDRQDLIFATSMTEYTDLPLRRENSGYNVDAQVPPIATNLDPEDGNNVTFRVLALTLPFAGHNYFIQIARPMERLKDEYTDLAIDILIGLVAFALALVPLGFYVAGKIMQPISAINTLAEEISEKTLDKRIPLGKNRDELYWLSSSLNRMFDRLQFSFQRQKTFFSNASHELKTPLAMQRLFFDGACLRNDLPEDFQQQVDRQVVISYRMDRLIKSILEISALELQDFCTFSTVDLSMISTTILQDFNEIFMDAGVQLRVEIEPEIVLQGDEEKLRQVLINVIDNAIKYNSGEEPKIQFLLCKKTTQISIEVYNTCQGISEDDLSQVFNQFYRVEKSRATEFGGSGLGLTIVKRIVELHNGRIDIESDTNQGVWVRIMLPQGNKDSD